jgi:AhpC/TSA family
MYPIHPHLTETLIADRAARFQRAARISRLVRQAKQPAADHTHNHVETGRRSEPHHRPVARSVEAARDGQAGKVDFYAVAWTDDESSFKDFVDMHGLTFPQISDDQRTVCVHFNIPSQPALVLIGADGKVKTKVGTVEHESLDAALGGEMSPQIDGRSNSLKEAAGS